MSYQIEVQYIENWFASLDQKTKTQVIAGLELLSEEGPNLKRPVVGKIGGSKYKHMKELRPGSSGKAKIRILFAFDPQRTAVMLVGGDKATSENKWQKWYAQNIPIAEKIYQQHLQNIKIERQK